MTEYEIKVLKIRVARKRERKVLNYLRIMISKHPTIDLYREVRLHRKNLRNLNRKLIKLRSEKK